MLTGQQFKSEVPSLNTILHKVSSELQSQLGYEFKDPCFSFGTEVNVYAAEIGKKGNYWESKFVYEIHLSVHYCIMSFRDDAIH